MYVEISPRQSGKTTRMVNALVSYLRTNIRNNHYVALVTPNTASRIDTLRLIRDRLAIECSHDVGMEWPSDGIYNLVDDCYMKNIITKTRFGEYNHEPNMWFFDEFSFIPLHRVLHPIHHSVITNGYYCTSPSSFEQSLEAIVGYCRDSDTPINFHNPWTDRRFMEQYGFEDYMRQAVVGEWMEYMTANGFNVRELKGEIILKYIRKHTFINGK